MNCSGILWIFLQFSLCSLLYVIWLANMSALFLSFSFELFSPPNPSCTKFPHFLCTVCKIVVCSQHSFQFKEFNSQSASLTNSSRSPLKFPQPKFRCFLLFYKNFHGLTLFIFFISFRFSQMCLFVVVNHPIWLILKSFNIAYCIITQRVSLI